MAIRYTATATKALSKIPAPDARRIRSKIEQYHADHRSQANNVVKLQGRDGYRLRVGGYRVIFDSDGTVMTVLDVGPRGSIY